VQDFRLYERVKVLEEELDKTSMLVHTLRQEQQNMLEQIKTLKERLNDLR
jgi:hypothetical protein